MLISQREEQFNGEHGELYQKAQAIGSARETVEKSIQCWLTSALKTHLPETGLVGDLGCGSGRQFPHLYGAGRHVIGIDRSFEMLQRIDGVNHLAMADLGSLRSALDAQRMGKSVFCGDYIATLQKLCAHGFRLDAALLSFSVLYLDSPSPAIAAARGALRDGAEMFLASNIFVPSELAKALVSGEFGCDLENPDLHTRYPQGEIFRHLLHLDSGSIPLEDRVHHLGMYRDALPRSQWQVQEIKFFPADGCEQLHPRDRRFDEVLGPGDISQLQHPEGGFRYLKVGIRASVRARHLSTVKVSRLTEASPGEKPSLQVGGVPLVR